MRQNSCLRGISVLLIVAALLPAAVSAGVDFEILPYVQNVGSTSATVLCKPAGKGAARVEYGLNTAYGASAEGEIEYVIIDGKPKPSEGSIAT